MKAYQEFTETFIKLDIPRTEKKASMPREVKKPLEGYGFFIKRKRRKII